MLWLGVACAEPRYAELEPPGPDGGALAAQANAAEEDDSALCLDDVAIVGAECRGVVHCLGAGLCDRAQHELCCTNLLRSDCSAQRTCGNSQPAFCDGAEDCPAQMQCCFLGGVTQCVAEGQCPEPDTLCHGDGDCERNRCVAGRPDANFPLLFREWGFCRAPR